MALKAQIKGKLKKQRTLAKKEMEKNKGDDTQEEQEQLDCREFKRMLDRHSLFFYGKPFD